MIRGGDLRAAAIALALGAGLVQAAPQPDELLADPALEARARGLSKDIRCLVCRNESIDDSNADLARDLRLLVRERLVAGDSDDEVRQFLVDRYGEFVLLKPTLTLGNAALWLAGPVIFLLGGAAAIVYLKRRSGAAPTASAPLDAAEEAALARILSGDKH